MSDSLYFPQIELWTHLGVPEAERAVEQRVIVSVELFIDSRQVAKDDDVKKGIDYQELDRVLQAIAALPRKTIERLAEDIADALRKKYKPSHGMKISVTKFPSSGPREICLTIHRP